MVCSLSTLQNELGRRNLKLDAVRHCAGMPCHIYLFICIYIFLKIILILIFLWLIVILQTDASTHSRLFEILQPVYLLV